jgi:hypothetical protein
LRRLLLLLLCFLVIAFASSSRHVSGLEFSVSVDPSLLVVQQGSTGTATIIIHSVSNVNQTYSLSNAGSPNGISFISFAPDPVVAVHGATVQSNMNVGVTRTAVPGDYPMTISVDNGQATHSTSIILRIVPANQNVPEFPIAGIPLVLVFVASLLFASLQRKADHI